MNWYFYLFAWQIIMAIICSMVASSKRGWATGLIFFFYGLVIWPIALTHAILMKTSVAQNHSRIDGVLAGKPYRKLDDDSVTVTIEGNDVNFQSLEEAEQALSAKAFPVDNRSEAELIGQKFEAKTGIGRAVIFFVIISAGVGAYALKTIVSSPSTTEGPTDFTKAEPVRMVASQSEPTNVSDAPKQAISKYFTPALWAKEMLDIEKLAKDGRNLSGDQAFTLALRASAAIGAIDTMSPQPRGKFAKLNCSMAAQAIRNYIDDMSKDHLFSADDQMKDYKEYKPKCLKDLKR